MKKKFTARIGVVALMLTLVSICLLGGTMARYTTEVTGTGAANIAAWKVVFSAGKTTAQTADFNFTLAETKVANDNVKTDAIAPGDKGEIKVEINGAGSEVAYEYKIELNGTSVFSTTAGNVKFYSDASYTTPWSNADAFTAVPLSDVANAKTQTIYWQWENNDANNTYDTAAGKAAAEVDAADLEFTVKLTARQTIADPTAP